MKDNKKYNGIVTQFTDGKYTIKIGSRKYVIDEKNVSSIVWSENQEQISRALEGEVVAENASSKNVKTGYKLYAEITNGLLIPLDPYVTKTLGGSMYLIGGTFGFRMTPSGTSSNFLTDDSVYEYGFGVFYGSMSGSLSYVNPYDGIEHTTSVSSSTLITYLVQSSLIMKFKSVPVSPTLNVSLGPCFNFDTLESYPLGWKDYENYPVWMLGPDDVPLRKVNAVYIGVAAKIMAGLDISFSDSIVGSVNGGYLLLTKNRYNDLYKFGQEVEFFSPSSGVLAGGIYFEADLKFVF